MNKPTLILISLFVISFNAAIEPSSPSKKVTFHDKKLIASFSEDEQEIQERKTLSAKINSKLVQEQLNMLKEEGANLYIKKEELQKRKEKNKNIVQTMNDQQRIRKQLHQDILSYQNKKVTQARNKALYQNLPYYAATGIILTAAIIIATQTCH